MGRSLRDLGRHVSDQQDARAVLDREAGLARLLATKVPPAHTRRRRSVVALGLAAALLACAALVLVLRAARPLGFDVGDSTRGAIGAWIPAPAGRDLPLVFSDGSRLVLRPGGRARVSALRADGADVALERGTFDVAVVHRDGARWSIIAGPFTIRVVGTRFEVGWDPDAERLFVVLHEGAVTVSGPVVGDARLVRAGERLDVVAGRGALELRAPPEPAVEQTVSVVVTPAPSVVDGAPLHPGPEQPAPPVHRPRALSASLRPPVSTWRALALEGRYEEATVAAQHEGLQTICATASAPDLSILGDAARLGGAPEHAIEVFQVLRARFAGSSEATTAAFVLGRITQDQTKDARTAAAWFERYLSEAPRGAFGAEAAGRLVEALDQAGDRVAARRAAERYLELYPGGPHAALAKRVVDRATP
jgi:hypothetical protein